MLNSPCESAGVVPTPPSPAARMSNASTSHSDASCSSWRSCSRRSALSSAMSALSASSPATASVLRRAATSRSVGTEMVLCRCTRRRVRAARPTPLTEEDPIEDSSGEMEEAPPRSARFSSRVTAPHASLCRSRCSHGHDEPP